jgi:predicted permease
MVRYAFRRLAQSPGLAAAAVISIGLGIAANSTIFSMVSRFVLRPAPVGEPATLLSLHTIHEGDRCCNAFPWPLFQDVRDQAKSFSAVTAYFELVPASIGGSGEPERVWGQAATENFFDVARIGMTLGRGFRPGEEHLPVIVLSYGLWQRRFGADSAIAGKPVTLSGHPFTVVGVAPPAFRGVDPVLDSAFWVPLGNVEQLVPNLPARDSRAQHWLAVVARLRPEVTAAQADAELRLLATRFAKAHPETDKGGGFRFEQAGSLPPWGAGPVLMFLAALSVVVFLVLCIACANVANLLLAQASGRQREMAVRLALGATRGDLMRQLLTESVLLALGGGLLGVVLSLWATRALSAFHIPAPVPLDLTVSVDWRVLLYTFALSVGTGLLFGLAPAWAAARPILANALKGEDVLGRPGRLWSLRNVLVVSQIAMSLVLLCATGLFLRSLKSAAAMDVGFRSHGVLMMSVDPRLHGYTPQRTAQFLTQLRQRVGALPGITSVAATDTVPLSLNRRRDDFTVLGQAPPAGHDAGADLYMVTPGYFETMGMARVAGRDFAGEGVTAPKVAVVNETFVRTWFPKGGAVGQQVNGGGVTYQIIGVVNNIKSRTLGEELSPVLYRSLDQTLGSDPSFMGYSLLVRTAGNSAAMADAVRNQIRSLDSNMAVFNAATMEEHLYDALFLPRLAGTLFGIFGCVGLLLAAIGLYGVMSYSVSRRTREIGIRLALGAQKGGVERLVVRQGMLLTLIAITLGLGAAWAVAKFAAFLLYGVDPHDLMTFTAVPLFLGLVALLACWIPSRRAARVDPMEALRYE